jgi:hypothetical protein
MESIPLISADSFTGAATSCSAFIPCETVGKALSGSYLLPHAQINIKKVICNTRKLMVFKVIKNNDEFSYTRR